MYRSGCLKSLGLWRRTTKVVFQAAALAIVVALSVPARAGDDRAVKSRVPPIYPEIARRLKVSGEVKLQAVVDAQGKVKDVKTLSGNHMLAIAAEGALRQWKFDPGSGETTVVVAINFTLAQ